jgi:hypothetical protein
MGIIEPISKVPPPPERGKIKSLILELKRGETRLLEGANDSSVRACLSVLRKGRRMKFRSKREEDGVRVWRL